MLLALGVASSTSTTRTVRRLEIVIVGSRQVIGRRRANAAATIRVAEDTTHVLEQQALDIIWKIIDLELHLIAHVAVLLAVLGNDLRESLDLAAIHLLHGR